MLEDKKAAALRAIDASKNLKLEKLQTQAEEYQGLLENNGLVGYAQEVLKETDPSCFVQTAKQLHFRYLNYLPFGVSGCLVSHVLLTPLSKVLNAIPCITEAREMVAVLFSSNYYITVCVKKQLTGGLCPVTMP